MINSIYSREICPIGRSSRCVIVTKEMLMYTWFAFRLGADMRPRTGGRLNQFWEDWKDLGAPQSLIKTLQQGYSISLREEPELVPPNSSRATILEQGKMEVARSKVAQLALKGAIEEVSWAQAEQEPGLYSRLFCVPKRTSEGN